MKALLTSMLLLVVVLLLYEHSIGGADGVMSRNEERAVSTSADIERIEP